MKRKVIFTTTGESYYHFHMIGVGLILNYSVNLMQIIYTCEFTSQVIKIEQFSDMGGLSKEEFKQTCIIEYKKLIDEGVTTSLDYMDEPTIVGCIGMDLKLLQN